jgi:hypothetical protein
MFETAMVILMIMLLFSDEIATIILAIRGKKK